METLKQSALTEEATGFDPSGSSGGNALDHQDPPDLAQSWHGDTDSTSGLTEDTDLTEISQALHRAELDEGGEQHYGSALSLKDNIQALKEMFPEMKEFNVTYVLKKSNNDFGKAVEELLSQSFLEDEDSTSGTAIPRKGVDAFYDASVGSKGKKKKKERQRPLRRTSSLSEMPADKMGNKSSPSSRWDRAKEEIDFIAERTYISRQTISSAYHKHTGSLPATLAALCESDEPHSNPYISMAPTDTLDKQIANLTSDLPALSKMHATALVRFTYPSTASARELGRALVSRPSPTSDIVPQYSPRAPSPSSVSGHRRLVKSQNNLTPTSPAALAYARNTAFTQASAAYRKSKSNHLMGGAAAYYSSVGRDAAVALRKHQATAADDLVASQSRPGEVDLHGVTVQDANRIAIRKVEEWWEREAQEWSRAGKARNGALRFITGQGRHSEGGKSRLGPTVAKTLVKNDWKIEIGSGTIDVVGRATR